MARSNSIQIDENKLDSQLLGISYNPQDTLGSGAFGKVCPGFYEGNKEKKVAIKILHSYLPSGNTGNSVTSNYINDILVDLTLDHPFIIPTLAVSSLHSREPKVIMPRYTENLHKFFDKHKILSKEKESEHEQWTLMTLEIILNLGTAIQYLHEERNIVHNDIKLTNILIMHDQNVEFNQIRLSYRIGLADRAGKKLDELLKVLRPSARQATTMSVEVQEATKVFDRLPIFMRPDKETDYEWLGQKVERCDIYQLGNAIRSLLSRLDENKIASTMTSTGIQLDYEDYTQVNKYLWPELIEVFEKATKSSITRREHDNNRIYHHISEFNTAFREEVGKHYCITEIKDLPEAAKRNLGAYIDTDAGYLVRTVAETIDVKWGNRSLITVDGGIVKDDIDDCTHFVTEKYPNKSNIPQDVSFVLNKITERYNKEKKEHIDLLTRSCTDAMQRSKTSSNYASGIRSQTEKIEGQSSLEKYLQG